MPTSSHILQPSSKHFYPSALLPGQKCAPHTEKMKKFVNVTIQPLTSSLRIELTDGELQNGVAVGMRFGVADWRWCDVFFLCETAWVVHLLRDRSYGRRTTERDASHELNGDFQVLKKLRLFGPDVFDGRAISLYSILHDTERGTPSAAAYLQKEETIVEEGPWYTAYKNEFIPHRDVGLLDVRLPKRGSKQSDVSDPLLFR